MTNNKKRLFWSAGFLGFILVVSFAAAEFAPVYLNTTAAKHRIETAVSQKMGGKVTYERADVSFFPRLHVTIKGLSLSYPRTFRGTLQSVSIYPRFFPLIKGDVLVSKIQIMQPDFIIILPAAVAKSAPEFPSLEETRANIRSVLAYLQGISPGLVVEMDNGKFVLRKKRQTFLSLQNVTVHFNTPPGDMNILVKAATERWGNFSLAGVFAFSEAQSEVRDLTLSLGQSSISGFSATLVWDQVPRLDILSGSAVVKLDEIYSWLSSSESLTPFLKHVQLKRGVLTVSSLQASGPIDRYDTWHQKIAGKVSDILAESPWLPAPVSLNTRFLINGNTLEVTELSARLGSSSLDGVSARFTKKQTPDFNIYEGRALTNLAEVFQWRNKYEALNNLLKDVNDLSGAVSLSSMRMGGPLTHPEAWRFSIAGSAKNIAVDSSLLPASLAVTGNFTAEDNKIAISDTSVILGTSSLSHVTANVSGRKEPALEILDGRALLHLGEVFQWRTQYSALQNVLNGVDELDGTVIISSVSFKGPLLQPETGKINATGNLDRIFFNSSFFPGPVGLLKGDFSLVPDKLSFALQEATILDSAVSGTAVVSGITSTLSGLELTLSGKSGRNTLDWVFESLELPPALMIKTPVAFADSHLTWKKTTGLTFAGTASVANGPDFSVDLSQQGADFTIRRLTITDQQTKATFTLNWQKQAADFSFSGLLAEATLGRIFEQGNFGNGSIHGNLRTVIRTDQPLRSQIKGELAGDSIFIPWDIPIPTTINSFAIHAADDVLTVDTADVTWGKNHYSMTGAMTTSDEGIAFSIALLADGIEIQAIQQVLEQSGKKSNVKKTRSFPLPPIRGDILANSSYVKFGRFTFAPAHAVITVAPESVNMTFTDTKTCGISTPGSLLISRESISFTFTPSAKKESLSPSLDCLTGKNVQITGVYDLNARIAAQGNSKDILSTLEGKVNFKATDGKIYRYPLLAKIFSGLSVLELFRGNSPELGGKGFPYHSMTIIGQVHKGKFTIEKAYIGGKSLDLIAQGEVDLAAKKLDLVVLVAPFSTINALIRHIPLVKNVLGGTLITIPVKVSGDLVNPDVFALAPSAIGSRLLDILKNIVELPITIISPLLPKQKEQENKE
jgi:AsmA-like protein